MISSDRSGSRLPVGSSARTSCGSLTSARAIAMRCCSPPDSSCGNAFIRCCRPTHLSTWNVLRCCVRDRHAEHARHERDVLEHGHARDQLEVLEDEADDAAVGLHLRAASASPDRGRRPSAAPSLGTLLAQQQPQERRLAGAARAGEEDELALVDGAATGRAARRRRGCRASRGDGSRSRLVRSCSCASSAARSRSCRDSPCRPSPSSPGRRGSRTSPSCPPRILRDGVGVGREHVARSAPTIAPSSSICASPSAATMSSARAARCEHLLEHVLGDRAADRALRRRARSGRRARRRRAATRSMSIAELVQLARQLAHHPVARRLRLAAPRATVASK